MSFKERFIHYWQDWAALQRTPGRDRKLGSLLAFIAGAANAGGFLAVGQYTSHMTGIVSNSIDEVVLGHWQPFIVGSLAFVFFVMGAMFATWCVQWGLRHKLHGAYGLPFVFQAGSMLVFGVFGAILQHMGNFIVPLTVLQLCYLMGLQNAAFGLISVGNMRTTHLTGMTTDLGVELGKLTYYNRSARTQRVMSDRRRLWTQVLFLTCFVLGALAGALGFKRMGFIATVPLALLLLAVALPPLVPDVRKLRRYVKVVWRAYARHVNRLMGRR